MEVDSNATPKRRRVEIIEDKEFTDAEAAVYDRQIRLWGVEAQKRLNQANILVIGMSGLGAEVCKNIILGGVKSVTLMDHQNVTELDGYCQFLVSTEVEMLRQNKGTVGPNRAAASLTRAQLLNPMVNVLASSSSPDDKSDQFYRDFTIICAIGCKKSQIIRLNKIARNHGIKFFAADVFGFMGYIFSDLGEEHNFTREIVIPGTKGGTESVRISKGRCSFRPYQDVVNVDWKDVLKTQKKINPTTHANYVLLDFLEKFKRPPQPESRDEDYVKLLELRDEYLIKHNLEKEVVNDDLFMNVYGQLGPTCAINGGVLAQEVVKAVSHQDEPLVNFFVCNPESETSIVECIYAKSVYKS